MPRLTREQAAAALTVAQKPAGGVPAYLRWINRPLGGHIALRAAVFGMTPDQLTAISALLSGIGLLLMCVMTTAWTPPVAAVLLLAGYAFDSADGQLARIQRSGGPRGEWLDHVVDGVRAPLVHVAICVYLFRTSSPWWLLLLAALFSVMVSSWFLSQLLAEKLLPRQEPAAAQHGIGRLESLVKQPQDASTTYFVIAFLGLPLVFAVLYVALFAWQLIMFALSLSRKHHQLSTA